MKTEVVGVKRQRSRAFVRRTRVLTSASTIVGLLLVAIVLLLAVVGPLLSPYDYASTDVPARFERPGPSHLFGTDNFGRDIFTRVAHGARYSLLVGVASVCIALVVGTAIGIIAAIAGGLIEEIIMRAVDVLLAFPYIILAIAIMAILGPSLTNVVLVIGTTYAPKFIRLSHAQVLAIKELEYISSAQSLGIGRLRLVFRHFLPNMSAPVIVYATLTAATAINAEAALSFLGLGLQPPLPSWGGMVADGRRFLLDAPWISGIPGIAIAATVLGFNLIGDSIRDVLDPKAL